MKKDRFESPPGHLGQSNPDIPFADDDSRRWATAWHKLNQDFEGYKGGDLLKEAEVAHAMRRITGRP